jgi:fumarate reductase subunit D
MATNETRPNARRSQTPLYIDLFAAQAMVAAILWPIVGLIGDLPRNSDNSMKAIYTVPTFFVLAVVSVFLLWKRILPHRALRIVCWFIVGFGVLAIPATLIDVLQRHGS